MIARVPAAGLAGRRWDPASWDPRSSQPLAGLDPRFPVVDLGDRIESITYGPIVTGRPPEAVDGGVPVVTGRAFVESGLDLRDAVRVRPGCEFDPPRSRLRRGDLLLPRSGVGSLGRGRMAVWETDEPANVGCFVDRLRLAGLDPHFLWAYLRTRFGWSQISRLWNGVAQPNVSFGEVRALRVAAPPAADQEAVASAWHRDVLPHHLAYLAAAPEDRPGARLRAAAALDAWIARVEAWLSGRGEL
ncbi:hypothetical protein L6R50_10460 [Myxococcota bacterium]|nr:hypothetical protein [Myxococcota bacterium]